jgi:hypothetical protein
MEGLFSNTLCIGVLIVAAIIVVYLLMRRMGSKREPPAGTYDSKDYDSAGSIGKQRGGRAYDSEKFDSGATIGGAPERQAYDKEEIHSGGSIGGGPSIEEERPASSRLPVRESTVSDGFSAGEFGDADAPEPEKPRTPYRTRQVGKKVDSQDFDSGGSFGG